MVIERSMHPQFLSNTYLVGQEGGAGFFVDAGGPVGPLVHAADRHEMTPTHVLLTHRHHDHVAELAELTTVADEWEGNAFVRIWRGLDPEGDEPCTAMGEPATLILLGDDYDGGHKAWVRWPDGSDDIVGGSQVQRG